MIRVVRWWQWVEGSNSQLGKRGVNQMSGIEDNRREIVMNAVRKDGAGWEAIVGTGTTPHGDPVVQRRRCGEGSDVQEVITLVPKYEDDNLIFIGGQVDNISRTVYAKVDGGSDVLCILKKEPVVALGLDDLMVPRDVTRQCRVRGIGQQAGSGQMVTHEVWVSIVVDGRMVVDWETRSMAPVGGMSNSLRIEGWFAVLYEMSVPLLVGWDLLQGHDFMPRVANRQVVGQHRDMPAERIVTRMWTMAEVIQAIGKVQDEVYRTPVWHDMARSVGARDSATNGQVTGKAVIPPRFMKTMRLKYLRQVQQRELFAVDVESATVGIGDQTAAELLLLACVQGWDPCQRGGM